MYACTSNISIAIQLLQKEQDDVKAKIIQIRAGRTQPPMKKKYALNAKICTLQERFRNRQLSLYEYADTVSHLIYLDQKLPGT